MAESDIERRCAEATLLALRSSTRRALGPPPGPYIFLPEAKYVAREDAAAYLVAMRKPVECRPGVLGDQLTIFCRTIESPSASPAWNVIRKAAEQAIDSLRKEHRRSSPEFWVLLAGADESLLLELHEVRHWWSTYQLRDVTWGIDEADEAVQAAGAQALMSFGPPLEGAPRVLKVEGPDL